MSTKCQLAPVTSAQPCVDRFQRLERNGGSAASTDFAAVGRPLGPKSRCQRCVYRLTFRSGEVGAVCLPFYSFETARPEKVFAKSYAGPRRSVEPSCLPLCPRSGGVVTCLRFVLGFSPKRWVYRASPAKRWVSRFPVSGGLAMAYR